MASLPQVLKVELVSTVVLVRNAEHERTNFKKLRIPAKIYPMVILLTG